MTDLQHFDSTPDGLAALIRLAGEYVHPSDDLRPRVLEAARAQCGEQRAKRRIGQLAVLVVFAGIVMTSLLQRPARTGHREQQAASADQMLVPAESVATYGDSGWEMVETFTQLRRHHARLLRLAL